MPGSTVSINGGWREYYVGDSKMAGLLGHLNSIGVLEAQDGEKVTPVLDCCSCSKRKNELIKRLKGQIEQMQCDENVRRFLDRVTDI